MEMRTKDSDVCDGDSWAPQLQTCLYMEFSVVPPPSLDAQSHHKDSRLRGMLPSFKSRLHYALAV